MKGSSIDSCPQKSGVKNPGKHRPTDQSQNEKNLNLSPASNTVHPRSKLFAKTSGRIAKCNSSKGLIAIKQQDIDLVIWQRTLNSYLNTFLDQLEPSQLPDMRVLIRPDDLFIAAEPYLFKCGWSNGDVKECLLKDIHHLILTFASITKSYLVDVRLEIISDDACWKFHRDAVKTRLLTTYRGSTTEWVQPEHAAQALREQKLYNGPLDTLQINDVAIFRGGSAQSNRGIVHRSPQITDTGCTRLLLCLNERSTASPKPWQIC